MLIKNVNGSGNVDRVTVEPTSLTGLLGRHKIDHPERIRRQDMQWRPLEWAGVLKVQRSLNPPDAYIAVFSRDGQIHYITPLDQTTDTGKWVRDQMKDDYRMYVDAELRAGIVEFQRRVPDEDW